MASKRLVGSKLNLKISLSDGNGSRFVRAFLYDLDGVSLTPAYVDLVHQDKGLYSDDVAVMPNKDQVSAVYRVYQDAGRTILDSNYTQALDLFEKETFDPASLVSKPYAIFAMITRPRINIALISNPPIQAIIQKGKKLNALLTSGEIRVIIKQDPILGVVND